MRVSPIGCVPLLFALALVPALPVFGQPAAPGTTEIEPISSLKTPASPAFTLLGIEPASVERPGAPSDFAVTLIDHAKEPASFKNFAIEFGPYWLARHSSLTWQDDIKRNVVQSITRTATISAATAQTTTTPATTGLGMGLRTLLWSGALSQNTQDAIKKLADSLSVQGATFLALMYKGGRGELDLALKNGTLSPDKYDEAKRALMETVLKSPEFAKATRSATDPIVSREGFTLDVAVASTWDFPGNNWESRRFRKWGAWTTSGWQSGGWTTLGVLRYIHDGQVAAETNAIEAGARGIYSTDQSALSLEYLHRTVRKAAVERKHRLVAIVEHRLGEGTWLTASFGRDRTRADSPGTLIAQLGIALNLSRDRYKF